MLTLLIAGGLLAAQQVPLALDGLTRQTVEATLHGHAMRCEGVSLVDLLRRAKAMDDAPLKGEALSRVVVVTARDATLPMPALILQSLQVNLRAGALPPASEDGTRYLRIPLDRI